MLPQLHASQAPRSVAGPLVLLLALVISLAACTQAPAPANLTATAQAGAMTATTEQLAGGMAQTAQARAGSLAQTAAARQTTATALARSTITAATAEARTTATAVARALYPEATQVFRDEFVDNRNFWFVGVFQEIETDLIEDGVFKVRWAGKGTSYELWEVRELRDFIAEVECHVVSGGRDGSCALVFSQASQVGFYKFEVFADYYRLAAIADGAEPQILAEGPLAAPFEISKPFRLRVVRQGPVITIALNDHPLASVADRTFLSGKIGVSTSSYNEQGGVEVHFDNFTIWEIEP